MSDTDPDLRPQEANKPIAIDVVDGNLIVKRYDGSEESFPLGSSEPPPEPGPLVPHAQTISLHLSSNETLAHNSNGPIATILGASVFNTTNGSQIGSDIVDADLVSAGGHLDLGDDFHLQKVGGTGLFFSFRTPGLYLLSIQGPSVLNTGFEASVQGPHEPFITKVAQMCTRIPTGATLGAEAQMLVPVSDNDVFVLGSGSKVWQMVGFNDSDSTNMTLEFFVIARRVG